MALQCGSISIEELKKASETLTDEFEKYFGTRKADAVFDKTLFTPSDWIVRVSWQLYFWHRWPMKTCSDPSEQTKTTLASMFRRELRNTISDDDIGKVEPLIIALLKIAPAKASPAVKALFDK
jgi:hypothetical protein